MAIQLSEKIPAKAQLDTMNANLVKINDTLEKLVESGTSPTDHAAYDAIFQGVLDGTNTSHVFEAWAPRAIDAMGEGENRYDVLARFFTMLEHVGQHKTYTLRYYHPDVSSATEMTPMDDLADGRSAAQLCTDETTPVADWADEDPFTWYVRANALSLADGTMNVLAIEDVDINFDISGELAPVYVFSMALWKYEHDDGQYVYKSWRTARAAHYHPYAGDVAPDNTHRIMTWHPAFGGGLNSLNGLTSGAGRKPYNRASGTTGIQAARRTSAYEGLWCDCDTEWLLDMWQLRHWNLENSGIAEGCTSYNLQHVVALAEENVKRILVTPAQAANFLVRSTVMLGSHPSGTNNDRNTAANYDILDNVMIDSIETVTIDGTEYGALNLDVEETFTVPEGALVSTAPWYSGETEYLPVKKDGCTVSLTGGKTPLRVQGVEVLDGAYAIGLDPLYNFTTNAEEGLDCAVYQCRDSVNLSGSITSNYELTEAALIGETSGWKYVKQFVKNTIGIVFPKVFGESSTGYFKSAFYVSGEAGVRAPWRFGNMTNGANAGLACEASNDTPTYVHWFGRPRLSGSGKKRGEWSE